MTRALPPPGSQGPRGKRAPLTPAQDPPGAPAGRPILTVPGRLTCAQHSEATPTQRGPKMGQRVGWGPREPPGLSCRGPQGRGVQVTPGRREAQHRASTRGPDSWDPVHIPLGHPSPHLEPDATLLTTQTGQHEGDDSEEPGEGHGHHSQRGRPGELAEGGAVCRGRRGYRAASVDLPPQAHPVPAAVLRGQPNP